MNWDFFVRNRAECTLVRDQESGSAFVEMRQVVKTFKTPVGDFPALRDIDASFDRGEFVSIVGKSGSGKSTLVNMITGIDHPTSGSCLIGWVWPT
jgi:putative ABC transport system ATP-binding protein